jgi:hypothetical protein
MSKTWQQKYDNGKAPHVTMLDAPFAGIPEGGRLFIASPALIDDAIRKVKHGRTLSVEQLREGLAKSHFADATCPLTTGIFLRIVAERALEQLTNGAAPSEVTPFWRVIDPDSSLAHKLSCGPSFIERQRDLELLPSH